MKVFVTGASGFIGFHLCKKLLSKDVEVIGIDNFNSYYDPNLKEARLRKLNEISNKKNFKICLLYTSPSPRDCLLSRMPSSA